MWQLSWTFVQISRFPLSCNEDVQVSRFPNFQMFRQISRCQSSRCSGAQVRSPESGPCCKVCIVFAALLLKMTRMMRTAIVVMIRRMAMMIDDGNDDEDENDDNDGG